MTDKMLSPWYVYKGEQQLGPYSWEQLWQEARTKNILASTLVWNSEQTGWIAAEKIPGLIINSDFEATNPPPPPVRTGPVLTKKPEPANNRTLIIAIAAAAFIFVIFGASLIYLALTGDTPETAEPFIEVETVFVDDLEDAEQPENNYFVSDEVFGWSVAELDDESFQSGAETTADDDGPDDTTDVEAASDSQTAVERTPADSSADTPSDTDPTDSSTTSEKTVALLGGTYAGPLKDGLPHGQGYWTHPDGRTYSGSFIDGRKEGFGTMIFPGGERYVGYLKNGRAHGEGTMTHPDGRTVSGTWLNGALTEQ